MSKETDILVPRAVIDNVLIGGNHIALLIDADHPAYTATHDEALKHYGSARLSAYEAWCGWRTIMHLRDAVQPENTAEMSDPCGSQREAITKPVVNQTDTTHSETPDTSRQLIKDLLDVLNDCRPKYIYLSAEYREIELRYDQVINEASTYLGRPI